ncbi:hypothetical protein PILCRDRAFT_15868 [Piloderma croceum F 1598]|uniref:Uncharacterized protein n=1 Tax=Piloderma croceum (strain F 1598) TaxID=765440 RepID=A0A0C3B606_PILCF|nr:hypothetical protein PILCRDRAFT_15868 [Piloderma croceum F 1598]
MSAILYHLLSGNLSTQSQSHSILFHGIKVPSPESGPPCGLDLPGLNLTIHLDHFQALHGLKEWAHCTFWLSCHFPPPSFNILLVSYS